MASGILRRCLRRGFILEEEIAERNLNMGVELDRESMESIEEMRFRVDREREKKGF